MEQKEVLKQEAADVRETVKSTTGKKKWLAAIIAAASSTGSAFMFIANGIILFL